MAYGYGNVQWYPLNMLKLTFTAPVAAHQLAAAEAAGIGARLIRSSYTGRLARDISVPRPLGPIASEVGSDLPYAAIENWGGVIEPRNYPYLYIRDRRTSRMGGGKIVATATRVEHKGKHYLEAIGAAYVELFIYHLNRLLPP